MFKETPEEAYEYCTALVTKKGVDEDLCGARTVKGELCARHLKKRPQETKEGWVNEKEIGGKIHLILNNTVIRKLTLKEYERLIKNIDMFHRSTIHQTEQRVANRIANFLKDQIKYKTRMEPEGVLAFVKHFYNIND